MKNGSVQYHTDKKQLLLNMYFIKLKPERTYMCLSIILAQIKHIWIWTKVQTFTHIIS